MGNDLRQERRNRTQKRTRLYIEHLEERCLLNGEVQGMALYRPEKQLPEHKNPAWLRSVEGSAKASLVSGGHILQLRDPGAAGDFIFYSQAQPSLGPSDSVVMDAQLFIGHSKYGWPMLGGTNSVAFGFDDTEHIFVLSFTADPSGHGAIVSLNWNGDLTTPRSFHVPEPSHSQIYRIVKHGTSTVEAGLVDFTTGSFDSRIEVSVAGFEAGIYSQGAVFFGAASGVEYEGVSESYWSNVQAFVGCTDTPHVFSVGASCTEDRGSGGSIVGTGGSVLPIGLFGLQSANGVLQPTDSFGHFNYTGGTMTIGVNPSYTSGNFLPLFSITGSLEYEGRTLRAEGTIREEITGFDFSLFHGVWETDIWKAASSFLQDLDLPLFNELQLGGTDLGLSGLELRYGGLALSGNIKLPDSLGGFSLGINQGNAIILTPTGVHLNGASICLPNSDFTLLNLLRVQSTNVCMSYISNQDALRLQGRLSLPDLYGAKANLAGNNYIQVRNGHVDVVGTFSLDQIPFNFGGWGLTGVSLSVDTVNNAVGGTGTLRIPAGPSFTVGLGFFGGDLNYATLDVDGLNIPTVFGIHLQRIGGTVNHLSKFDPSLPEFSGAVGVTFGPELTGIKVPSWAGGATFGGSLLRLDIEGSLNANRLFAEGPLSLFNGLAGGSTDVEVNWAEGYFEGGVSLDLLGHVIDVSGRFTADTDLNFTVRGDAYLRLPKLACPVVCGQQIAAAHAYFQFSDNDYYHDDYIEGYGEVTLGWFGNYYAGVRYRFNGRVDVINSKVDPVSRSFPIDPGTPDFIFYTDWENEVGDVPIQIEAPDGTIYNEADFDDITIGLIPEWSDASSKAIGVRSPMPGTWTVHIAESDALGEVSFHGYHDTAVPTLVFATLDSLTGTIEYSAADRDSAASIALFYDTDNAGEDGLFIVDELEELDGPDSYVWDTTGVRSGDYYIYAKITDENNPPVYVYSTETITVANQPPVLESIGNKTVEKNTTLSFIAAATDPNRERLTFSLDGTVPDGVWIDDTTGEFGWTPPSELVPGDYQVTIRVTDNGVGNLSDFETITIQVTETNVAPSAFSLPDRIANEQTELTFNVRAVDANVSDSLTYSLDPGAPSGATINASTGVFSWTPDESHGSGQFEITVRVTDSGTPPLSDTRTFNVIVNEENSAPVIDPVTTKIVDKGTLLAFTVLADDPDTPKNALSFSLSEPPDGASIDSATGEFSWSPSLGGIYDVTVVATDDGSPPRSSSETFRVVVNDVQGPRIERVELRGTKGVQSIVLIADEVLNASANVLANYSVRLTGKDRLFNTGDDSFVALTNVTYDRDSRSITLGLGSIIKAKAFFQIVVSDGLADFMGNRLDQNGDGTPDSFSQIIGRGTSLAYVDGNGDAVSIKLSGGGVMELTRAANGEGQQLTLLNTVPGRSSLTGSVRAPKGGGGDSRTTLTSITGSAGVRNGLPMNLPADTPQFVVGTIAAVLVDALLDADELGREVERDGLAAKRV